jgi:hypothetical protein
MRLQTVFSASSFVLSKQMMMKRKHSFNFCYILSVVIVLLVYSVQSFSAIVSGQSKGTEKVEKSVEQSSTETLHSELLFK